MNYSSAVHLSESYYDRSFISLIRPSLGRWAWRVPAYTGAMALFVVFTSDSPIRGLPFLMAGFAAGMAAIMIALLRQGRHDHSAAVSSLGDPLRTFTITDEGVNIQLGISAANDSPQTRQISTSDAATSTASEAPLFNVSASWSSIQTATRQEEGWLLDVRGEGQLFVPAAVVTPEVDEFIRRHCASVGIVVAGD